MRSYFSRLKNYLKLDLGYFLIGGFWTSLALIFTTITGIILSYLYATFWPADVYGRYSFLISVISFLGLAALPGMSQAVTQAAAEGKISFIKLAQIKVFKYSLIGTLSLSALGIYFYFSGNTLLSYSSLISAFIFPFSASSNLIYSALNGQRKFKQVAYITIIGQLLSISLIAFALIKHGSIVVVTIASLGSLTLFNLLLTIYLNKNLVENKKSKSSFDDLLTLGKNQSISQLFAISADYFDRLLIPTILGFSNNAIYSFATIFPNQLHNIFKSFITLGLPKITELSQKTLNQTLVKRSLQLEILITLTVGFYILIAPFIFNNLYPQYKTATTLSQVLSLSLLYFPSNLLALNLIKLRKNKTIHIINLTYNIVSLLSLIISLHLFGITGAAISKIISRLSYGASIYYFFKKLKKP